MKKSKELMVFFALLMIGTICHGATVRYTISGDILSPTIDADTFTMRVSYNDQGDVKRFSLSLDEERRPVWRARRSGTEMIVLNGPPFSSSDAMSYGDLFSISGETARSRLSTDIAGLTLSLTNSEGTAFVDDSVPLDLSLDMFDGGIVSCNGVNYGNALYALVENPVVLGLGSTSQDYAWEEIGSITSVCKGFRRDCEPPHVVPIPTALALFVSGLLLLFFRGVVRK